MKLKATIVLPPPPPFQLDLDIIPFDLVAVFGKGSKFEDKGPVINGLGDGVTGFIKTLAEAVTLFPYKKEQARTLLFPTGLREGQTVITGEDRLKALADRFLADPDLGWSLYKEKGQKTLYFFRDTFDITWVEFLRRTFRDAEGHRCAVGLHLGSDHWAPGIRWLGHDRDANHPALGFSGNP